MNELFRKQIIGLKRRPHNIPFLLLIVCCAIYTFQLTAHSNASMYVSSRIIALYVFIITLASILTIFSFMNAFSKGRKGTKKRRVLMMAVVYGLIAVQLLLDAVYLNIMIFETAVRDNPVPITADIAASMNWTYIHLGVLAFTTLVIVLIPVYHKLLLRIDTAVNDEAPEELDDGEQLVIEDGVL